MTIRLSCCFWRCSLIIRNKLTWKQTRLLGLSAPLSIQTAPLPPPPTITPAFPAPQPRQPLCPLVSGHLAWQSIILTAPRERKRETKRQKDGGYFDFQTWGPIFLYLRLSFLLSLLYLPLFYPFYFTFSSYFAFYHLRSYSLCLSLSFPLPLSADPLYPP